jgi:hypothetical protein
MLAAMSQTTPAGTPSPVLKPLRIVCLGQGVAALIYAALGWVLLSRGFRLGSVPLPPNVERVLGGVALGMLVAGAWLAFRPAGAPPDTVLAPPADPRAPAAGPAAEVTAAFRRWLIPVVLLEGSAIVWTITALLTGHVELLAGTLVCAGLIFTRWPRDEGS